MLWFRTIIVLFRNNDRLAKLRSDHCISLPRCLDHFDPRRPAAAVRSDDGHRDRRGHASDVVATDLLDVAIRMPRDADRSVEANGDHVERRIEAAAIDEFADELGEALLVELAHAGMVAKRRGITVGRDCKRCSVLSMSESKEHIDLRFQAAVIAGQLPDNRAEALLVLDYPRQMVVEFWDDSSGVVDS